MANRELRKMNRKELLELLIASEKENEQLRDKLRNLEAQLQNRELQIENAGSMAEAALTVNGVFESLDKASAQYLENIKRCSERQESIYDSIVSEAEKKAREIIDEAEIEKKKKISEADEHWVELSTRLEAFYREHEGLREYLQTNHIGN